MLRKNRIKKESEREREGREEVNDKAKEKVGCE